jgi:chaperonin GroEL
MNRLANHDGAAVVFPPRSRQAMLRGVETVVSAIRPTLGPLPRAAAVTPPAGTPRPIELLDDGGLIARRIIALPDRDEDAGAMLVRHVTWRVRERAGDGSATAAVLFGAVFAGGVRAIAAGADPGRLREGLEHGARLIADELARSAREVDGGEGGLLGREMGAAESSGRVLLRDAAIALTDLEIDSPVDLLAFLDRARGAGIRSLAIVARRFSDQALRALLADVSPTASINGAASSKETLRVIAVRTPGSTLEEQFVSLQDLALLCAGQPIVSGAGQTLGGISPLQLGHARRVWATPRHFGIAGGGGEPASVQTRIEALQRAATRTTTIAERESLQRRMGKLMSSTAVVSVGGATDREGKARRDRARRAVIALREALRCGVVPGGGAALLACRERLAQQRNAADNLEDRYALAILLTAVEAPFRTIVANAGQEPERLLHALSQARPGSGFDAVRGEIVEMIPAGIADAASVARTVVEIAVLAAAQACTIGVLVHSRRRQESVTP